MASGKVMNFSMAKREKPTPSLFGLLFRRRRRDEQIRWLYTAATRAMDQLVVSTQKI